MIFFFLLSLPLSLWLWSLATVFLQNLRFRFFSLQRLAVTHQQTKSNELMKEFYYKMRFPFCILIGILQNYRLGGRNFFPFGFGVNRFRFSCAPLLCVSRKGINKHELSHVVETNLEGKRCKPDELKCMYYEKKDNLLK